MTRITRDHKMELSFEIISAKIVEQKEDRKHVVYTLQICSILHKNDESPLVIARRYTDFLDLYTSLKRDYPSLMETIVFPKKALTGNFSSELISARSTGFESLLKHITSYSQLRNSFAFITFLQDVELKKAKDSLNKKEYILAYPILEYSFKVLNKIFSDRSPAVLLALLRLIACGSSLSENSSILKWADLALHRFNGVSDSDFLQLYVPLYHTCLKLWQQNGRDTETLEKSLLCVQKMGVKMEETSLIDSVNAVEQKVFGSKSLK